MWNRSAFRSHVVLFLVGVFPNETSKGQTATSRSRFTPRPRPLNALTIYFTDVNVRSILTVSLQLTQSHCHCERWLCKVYVSVTSSNQRNMQGTCTDAICGGLHPKEPRHSASHGPANQALPICLNATSCAFHNPLVQF